jgi:hypothetical protein
LKLPFTLRAHAQVPSFWSVREFWPGDNYALALAYMQAGLPEGG